MAGSSERGAHPVSPEKPCVICGKPAKAEHRPFCSRHCADVDLHRWFSGSYALPATPDPDHESDHDGVGGGEL